MKKKFLLFACISIIVLSAGCNSSDIDDKAAESDSQITQTQPVEITETVPVTEISTDCQTSSEIVSESQKVQNNAASLVSKYSESQLPDFVKQIDWSENMIVNNNQEFIEYINKNAAAFNTDIPVILAGECSDDTLDLDFASDENGILAVQFHSADLSYDNIKGVYALINVGYYPSAYIINAYKTGDASALDSDNLAVYNKAVDFLENKLDKNAADIVKEKQIHDYICDMVTYYTNDNDEYTYDNIPRYRTATGAFLDGSANCMGYTDSFYMLCKMAGFEIGKVSGDEAMKHIWNVITLDNKKYVVDVTWDDDGYQNSSGNNSNNRYTYFNAALDVISQEYRYDSDNYLMKQVVQTTDENYFYGVNNSDFGYMTNSYDEFYNKIKQLIEDGETSIYIACKNNVVAGDTNDMANKIFERIDGNISLSGSFTTISGYSFAYISVE